VACQTGVSRGSEQAFGFVVVQNPVESCQTALILLTCVDPVALSVSQAEVRPINSLGRLLDQPHCRSVVCGCLDSNGLQLFFAFSAPLWGLICVLGTGPPSYRYTFYFQDYAQQIINLHSPSRVIEPVRNSTFSCPSAGKPRFAN